MIIAAIQGTILTIITVVISCISLNLILSSYACFSLVNIGEAPLQYMLVCCEQALSFEPLLIFQSIGQRKGIFKKSTIKNAQNQYLVPKQSVFAKNCGLLTVERIGDNK